MAKLGGLWHDRSGAVMVEYAFMASLVAILAIAGVRAFETSFSNLLTFIADELNAVATP